MEHGKLIAGLNEALNREVTTIIRYLLQGSAIQGLTNQPLREMYRREVNDEVRHAQYLADKIAIFGGMPVVKPDLTPPPKQIVQMLENDLAAEEADVAHYRELAKMAGGAGEIELKLRMEEQAADESRHAEELRRMRS